MLTGAQPLEEGELRRRQAALLPFRENIERISDDILLNGSLPAVARAADGGRRLTLLRNYRDTYVALLEKTFLIRELTTYSRTIRAEQLKSPRIYFTDLGIRNMLLGITDLAARAHFRSYAGSSTFS